MIPTLLLFRCWDTGVEPEPPPPQRPVVVLLDRGDGNLPTQAALWLRTAEGAARDHIDAVTLVWETPAEVAAWTQTPVPAEDGMVLVDMHTREQTGHAALHLPNGPLASHYLPPGDANVWPREVVRAFDAALVAALGDMPPGTLVRRAPQVVGTTICSSTGCGTTCEDRKATAEGSMSCGMGQVDGFTAQFLKRWPPEDPSQRFRVHR